MNIYDAVLAAADHIERNPHLFRFNESEYPPDCGTPGCALGWIAHFMGFREGNVCRSQTFNPVLAPMGLEDDLDFYRRMDVLLYGHYTGGIYQQPETWRNSAYGCAKAMRLYAAKYLAKPQQQPPDWQAMAQRLASEPSIPMEAA